MKDVEKVKVYHVDEYCEGASHFCFSERKDVALLEDYEKLREENERLKGEVDFLSMRRDNFCDAMEELVENGAVDTFDWTGGLVILAKDTNYEYLRKENAKLKCLALHLFKCLAYHEYRDWGSIRDGFAESKLKERCVRNADRWRRINERCYEAYRKAKESLKEEK